MPSKERYMELFTEGCNLSEGLIQLDGRPPKSLGFFDKRRLRKAKKIFELSALESPDNAAPYLMLAKVSHSLSDKKRSLAYLIKAWNLEPANLILLIELSGAYGVLGKHREAISILERGLRSYPNEPRILFNLGLSYLFANKPESAVEIFTKTVEVEPSFEQNHKLLKYSKAVLSGKVAPPKSQREISKYT